MWDVPINTFKLNVLIKYTTNIYILYLYQYIYRTFPKILTYNNYKDIEMYNHDPDPSQGWM